jgi:hypothetical protein
MIPLLYQRTLDNPETVRLALRPLSQLNGVRGSGQRFSVDRVQSQGELTHDPIPVCHSILFIGSSKCASGVGLACFGGL